MKLYYKILSLNDKENSVEVRYYTDFLSQIDLCNDFNTNGTPKLDNDGDPVRCRTDYNINLYEYTNPTESDLKKIIEKNAPVVWFEMMEKVVKNEIDFSQIRNTKGLSGEFDSINNIPPNSMMGIFEDTPKEDIQLIIQNLNLSSSDTFMDLGSGDGRIVIAAAQAGAKSIGIDNDLKMIEDAKINAQNENVDVVFKNEDFFTTDLSIANIFYMNLFGPIVHKLALRLIDLPPGTKIVSYTYLIPWKKPDNIILTSKNKAIYFWTI